MTDPADTDPLEDLRRHVRATREAAERLHRDAEGARAEGRAGRVPPAGWATPEDRRLRAEEAHATARLLTALRELLPADLQVQVTEVVRQLLILARAIIDWLVDRLAVPAGPTPGGVGAARNGDRPTEPRVEEVPIG